MDKTKLIFRDLFVFAILILGVADVKSDSFTNKKLKSHNSQNIEIPNDPLFSRQYYFYSMQILDAWRFTKGDPNCVIGIIEGDMDAEHPDYKDNIIEVHKLEDMIYGANRNSVIHGTHVVGLIAAKENNGLGIAGIAPDCKIIAGLSGIPPTKGVSKKDYIKHYKEIINQKINFLMKYLVDKGCKVINCSLNKSVVDVNMFDYAIKNDVVVVLASGNDDKEELYYEKLPDGILIVGGIGMNNKHWEEIFCTLGKNREGANYGSYLDVVGPVEGLVLCYPTNIKYRGKKVLCKYTGKGTSYAAPMGTALAALIRSLRPDLDAKTVIKIIQQGADDLDIKGFDKHTGYGRLNFYKSLELAKSWSIQGHKD